MPPAGRIQERFGRHSPINTACVDEGIERISFLPSVMEGKKNEQTMACLTDTEIDKTLTGI